jgi:predicted CopG family antitoxin
MVENMARTINISEEVYQALKEDAQDKGISPDALAEKLISGIVQKKTSSWHQSLKEKILKENPELANRTKDEIIKEFDRLSNKIAENSGFETLEEMEQFMRREEFDPRRYKCISDR